MSENIIEAAELPANEKLYLKKGMFEYRVIHPIHNEDGSWNYINLTFGGYGNLFKLLLFVLIVFLFIIGAREVMMSCKNVLDKCQKNCPYISHYNYSSYISNPISWGDLNVSPATGS